MALTVFVNGGGTLALCFTHPAAKRITMQIMQPAIAFILLLRKQELGFRARNPGGITIYGNALLANIRFDMRGPIPP
jgi:hypothetical protein